MDSNLFQSLIYAIGLVIAITIHEFSHAYTADYFGDPTPRSYGRISLNPLRHLDPVGTLMLIFFKFGWGKPVPIDPYNLKTSEETMVAFAGPLSNFILAAICAIIFRFIPVSIVSLILYIFIQTNLVLGIFNLLPIPPLDGSKIFLNLLPEEQSVKWQQAFDQYGMLILIVLMFLPIGGSNVVSSIISPLIKFFMNILVN